MGPHAAVLGLMVRMVKGLLLQSPFKRRGSGQSLTHDQMEQSFGIPPIRLKSMKEIPTLCAEICGA